jgi:hypothetical protein
VPDFLPMTTRSIDSWVGAKTDPRNRERSPYGATWTRTQTDLDRELRHLSARDVVMGIDLEPAQIRLDGRPRAGSSVPPPIVLTFDSRVGPMRLQCDRFDHWQTNVRAIGLTLQRLRLVDEGGVTKNGEQYRGFGALPPGAPLAMPAAMTLPDAKLTMLGLSGLPLNTTFESIEVVEAAFRSAAKQHHPDAGGDPARFRRLVDARDTLLKAAS